MGQCFSSPKPPPTYPVRFLHVFKVMSSLFVCVVLSMPITFRFDTCLGRLTRCVLKPFPTSELSQLSLMLASSCSIRMQVMLV
jgi:hypothetical protein